MKPKIILLVLSLSLVSVFSLEVGDKAPSFANPDVEGSYLFSKNYIGKGWVLLDFFATWCEPCKEKLPKLLALNKEYMSSGLNTIILAIDKQGPEIVKPFFEPMNIEVPVLIDRYQVTIRDKYEETSLPVYFLIDPEGVIQYKGNDIENIHSILQENLNQE